VIKMTGVVEPYFLDPLSEAADPETVWARTRSFAPFCHIFNETGQPGNQLSGDEDRRRAPRGRSDRRTLR
jgi:hypothetical protein